MLFRATLRMLVQQLSVKCFVVIGYYWRAKLVVQ